MKSGCSAGFTGTSFLLIVLSPVIILSCLEVPYAVPMGLLATSIILWVTNLIPISVTGMLIPCLAIVFGVLSPAAAFAPFGSGILALFVGVFLLVRAFKKFELDRRIALLVLRSRIATVSPGRIVFVTAWSAWFLGMWMSNTATCAVLLPICLSILDWSKDHLTKSQYDAFSTRLLLTCAYTPSIGGMATPVGSVPNALAVEHLSKQGIDIGFFEWFWIALPLSLTLLGASLFVLRILFPLSGNFRKASPAELIGADRALHHRVLIVVFCLVVSLWLVPDLFGAFWPEAEVVDRLPLAVPALLGAASLFVIRLEGKSLLEAADLQKIEWGTIFLFGGGLCLGEVLNVSGAAPALAQTLLAQSQDNIRWLPLTIASVSTMLSEISSNTTTASIMVPILGHLFQFLPPDQSLALILSGVFAAGLGFMLPISTPPNSLVFGTGKVKLIHMVAAGLLLDLLGIVIISVFSLVRMG